MGQGWSLRHNVEAVLFQPPTSSYGHDTKNLIWLDGVDSDGNENMVPAVYIKHPEVRTPALGVARALLERSCPLLLSLT